MLMKNTHIRALDRFFESAMGKGHTPFAIMDQMLEQTTPHGNGNEFTVYKMTPVRYRVEEQPNGSVHYNIIEDDRESTEG
jgi:hypothetical protein